MKWLAWRHVTVQNNIIHLSFLLSSHCPRGGVVGVGAKKKKDEKLGKSVVLSNVWGGCLLCWTMLSLNTSTFTGRRGSRNSRGSNISIKQCFKVRGDLVVKLFLDQRGITGSCFTQENKNITFAAQDWEVSANILLSSSSNISQAMTKTDRVRGIKGERGTFNADLFQLPPWNCEQDCKPKLYVDGSDNHMIFSEKSTSSNDYMWQWFNHFF